MLQLPPASFILRRKLHRFPQILLPHHPVRVHIRTGTFQQKRDDRVRPPKNALHKRNLFKIAPLTTFCKFFRNFFRIFSGFYRFSQQKPVHRRFVTGIRRKLNKPEIWQLFFILPLHFENLNSIGLKTQIRSSPLSQPAIYRLFKKV